MSADEVSGWFRLAKLYIDFGPHPGKDRMPREAAVAACCVITNRTGAANFEYDVSIPDTYKIDDRTPDFVTRFGPVAERAFNDFAASSAEFDAYRARIHQERQRFAEEVEAVFGQGCRDPGPHPPDGALWARRDVSPGDGPPAPVGDGPSRVPNRAC